MSRASRVVVLDADGVFAIEEIDLPEPAPHQVVLDVFASGIQHEQVLLAQEPPERPAVVGCEASGRVVAVGGAVTRVVPGDVVLVTPVAAEATERQPEPVTLTLHDGTTVRAEPVFTWATTAVVDEQHVTPLPAAVFDREAAALLGDTVRRAVAAIDAATAAGATTGIAVFGAGAAGQAILLVARAAGIEPRIAVDSNPARLDRAKVAGATDVVTATSGGDAIAAVKAIAGSGVQVVVDCIDEHTSAPRPGAGALATGGLAILHGARGTAHRRTLLQEVAAEHGYAATADDDPTTVARCIALFESRSIDPSVVVADRFTIEQVNEATMRVEEGSIPGAAILVFEPVR